MTNGSIAPGDAVFDESPQPNVVAGGAAALSARFWLLIAATGAGAGVGGGLLMWLLRAVQHLAWAYSAGDFLDAVRQAGPGRRIAVVAAAGILAGAVRWAMKRQPGGHAGEVNEAIWFRSGRLDPLQTFARAVLSIVIVGMGASLGREAAPKQTGAMIGSVLSRWLDLAPGERRLLVACGAGAGMAAVYDVPFGGALFALEVLLGTLALPLVAPALMCSLLATWVSRWFLGQGATYEFPAYQLTTTQIVWAAVAGPLIGLAAIAYVRLIGWADGHKPEGWPLVIAPFAVFAALALAGLVLPELLGNGKDAVQEALVGRMGVPLLLAMMVLKPVCTAGCLGSGAPGGLFTPTMTCGATLGGVLGEAWSFIWPGAPAGSCALIGAAALLAAATQAPVCAIVLVVELTRHVDLLMVPLMLAVAGAAVVQRRFEARSIYSARIHRGRAAAAIGGDAPTTAYDRLIRSDCPVVSAAAGHAEVARLALATGRPPIVLDEDGRPVGIIPLAAMRGLRPALPIATAGELAQPVSRLESTLSEAEALSRLRAAGGELPVVDAATGKLLGVAATR